MVSGIKARFCRYAFACAKQIKKNLVATSKQEAETERKKHGP